MRNAASASQAACSPNLGIRNYAYLAIVFFAIAMAATLVPLRCYADSGYSLQNSEWGREAAVVGEVDMASRVNVQDAIVETKVAIWNSWGEEFSQVFLYDSDDALFSTRYVKKSGSEFIKIDEYGEVELDARASLGVVYEAHVLAIPETDSSNVEEQEVLLRVMGVPDAPDIADALGGPGDITVRWDLGENARCDGYELQVSLKRDFSKSKRSMVKGSSSSMKRVSGLKAGKRYYVRVRSYVDGTDGRSYSQWSDIEKSKKVRKVTKLYKKKDKVAKKWYGKVKKTAKKYGWTVGEWGRTWFVPMGASNVGSGTSRRLVWTFNVGNEEYDINVTDFEGFPDGWLSADYEIYDKAGKLIRDVSVFSLVRTSMDAGLDIKKGLLRDLKRFSRSHQKKPRLNVETVYVSKGDRVDVKVLNTNKKAKWSFVDYMSLRPYGADKMDHHGDAKDTNRAFKLKKTKTGVTVIRTKKRGDDKYYCLRAVVGGKKYYLEIRNEDRW